jgi:ribose 5-phosphate isomerase B
MRIHIGSDHAGLELKAALVEYLQSKGHEVKDAVDDYPDFCIPAAIATVADPTSLGIVLGGSGNGEQIAANKVKGVRAVLAWSVETAKLGRDHNNANVVGIGGRMHSIEDCKAIIDAFIETPFSNDERHVRRINKISKYENEGPL